MFKIINITIFIGVMAFRIYLNFSTGEETPAESTHDIRQQEC